MSLEQLLAWIPPGSPEESLARQVEFTRLPAHVAIIMDGNGRWAAQRHLPRVEGHRAGIDAVRDVVETSARVGIRVLTLYAFSVENWKRPRLEVSTLMKLLKRYLRLELDTLLKNDIRFTVLGRPDELAPDVRRELAVAETRTAGNSGMQFNIALNYGGRAEIVDAVRRMIDEGVPAGEIDEKRFAQYLYTAGQPDPDLLIRTSGEMRVSNFLLWQIAYSEIWVTDTLWPDFRCRHLLEALVAYQKRDRRYGGIAPAPLAATPRCRAHMQRLLSGVVLIVGIGAAIWFLTTPQLLILAEAVLVLGFAEYAKLAEALGARVLRPVGCVAAVLAAASLGLGWPIEVAALAALLAVGAIMVGSRVPGPSVLADAAATLFPMLYLGLPLGALVAMHGIAGRQAVFVLLATIILSDTAQYYTGRLFGRHKLSPIISPKKTVEGALGGFVVAPVVMVVAAPWWLPGVSAPTLLLVGLLLVGLGIAGDLFESLLKRSAGVKDSSTLIPGHGGVLDRIDALLFAAPAFYLFLKYGVGAGR